jgi:hypothetical protein
MSQCLGQGKLVPYPVSHYIPLQKSTKAMRNIILIIGLLMTAGGVAGVGFLYRDMKTENLIHARTGMLPVKLSEITDWKSATFTFYQPGTHKLGFSMQPRQGLTEQATRTFHGKFEVEILSPDGISVFNKLIESGISFPQDGDSTDWTTLDTFQINNPTEHSWTLRTRVTRADSTYTTMKSELFILPPQQYDIENYLTGNMYKLLGMGILVLTGFILIVYSGSVGKQKQ